jgi:hypothetical protein
MAIWLKALLNTNNHMLAGHVPANINFSLMIKNIVKPAIIIAVITIIYSLPGCKKDKKEIISTPQPDEQELITTMIVKATRIGASNDVKFYNYKVQNGFNNPTKVTVRIDTIVLQASQKYNIEILVLDESKTPAKDITPEIIDERNAHLFFYAINPATGNGSLTVSERDTDKNGQDFGRTCTWLAGAAGKGQITITLLHGPRRKEMPDIQSIGGATDAEAIFPVLIN